MTSLTATPAQLKKLGLISAKAAKALGQAPQEKAKIDPGSGSGDETLLNSAQVARQLTGDISPASPRACPVFKCRRKCRDHSHQANAAARMATLGAIFALLRAPLSEVNPEELLAFQGRPDYLTRSRGWG